MASDTKHLEITLETKVESVNLAEEMCLRVAEAAGFWRGTIATRIGMSVREGRDQRLSLWEQGAPPTRKSTSPWISPPTR